MKDKQWYVDQHRKMWNWIADQIEEAQSILSISKLKKEWFATKDFPKVKNECFACEYANGHCKCGCLFNWNTCNLPYFVYCFIGLYSECKFAGTWQEQAALARKIANLPVREDV